MRREFSAGKSWEVAPAAAYVPIANDRSRGLGPRGRRRSSLSSREWEELADREDVHMRLMRRYQEAPTSWYLTTFVVMIAVGIFVVE